MDLKYIGWEVVDWIHVVQDKDRGCWGHGNELSRFMKCREFEFLSNY
jgi:hypothetical protein